MKPLRGTTGARRNFLRGPARTKLLLTKQPLGRDNPSCPCPKQPTVVFSNQKAFFCLIWNILRYNDDTSIEVPNTRPAQGLIKAYQVH